MKQIQILFGILAIPFLLKAQGSRYEQTNKVAEYAYGVIENNLIDSLSGIERIKYNLTYSEKTEQKVITDDYFMNFIITMDSMSYEKPWMNLARRYEYGKDDIRILGKDGTLINTLPYTEDQKKENSRMQRHIMNKGYHPGLAFFPELPDTFRESQSANGINIERINPGSFRVTSETQTTTYNKDLLTIIREWTDGDGYKNKETSGYAPYGENKGYVLSVQKREKFVHSIKGPCITEVKLNYMFNYQINDAGHLLDKAMRPLEVISISPNPNDGQFNISLALAPGSNVMNIEIVNIMTNQVIQIPAINAPTFPVNISNESPGQYVIRITTTNSVLTKHFIKN